jgi:hypothetical protein
MIALAVGAAGLGVLRFNRRDVKGE